MQGDNTVLDSSSAPAKGNTPEKQTQSGGSCAAPQPHPPSNTTPPLRKSRSHSPAAPDSPAKVYNDVRFPQLRTRPHKNTDFPPHDLQINPLEHLRRPDPRSESSPAGRLSLSSEVGFARWQTSIMPTLSRLSMRHLAGLNPALKSGTASEKNVPDSEAELSRNKTVPEITSASCHCAPRIERLKGQLGSKITFPESFGAFATGCLDPSDSVTERIRIPSLRRWI